MNDKMPSIKLNISHPLYWEAYKIALDFFFRFSADSLQAHFMKLQNHKVPNRGHGIITFMQAQSDPKKPNDALCV